MSIIYKLLSEIFSEDFSGDINSMIENGVGAGDNEGVGASTYFNEIGFTVIGVVALITVLHYIVIDHPRFNKALHWCVVLLINVVLSFGISWIWMNNLLVKENLLTVENTVPESFTLNFAEMNGIFAIIVFFVASMIAKYFSNNNRYNPF